MLKLLLIRFPVYPPNRKLRRLFRPRVIPRPAREPLADFLHDRQRHRHVARPID